MTLHVVDPAQNRTIAGELKANFDIVILTSDDGTATTITEPGFIERLIETVPAYVGGAWLYRDCATLSGACDGHGQDMTQVLSGLIQRDEGDYRF